MTGTFVQDALAPNLLAGATLNAAGTTNGTVRQLNRPGEVIFRLDTSTVASTGNSATLKVVIKGCDTTGFSTDVVTYGTIELTGTDAAQSDVTRQIAARVYKTYVRVTVTAGGTAPVYTGATVYAEQPHYQRVEGSTA